MIRSLYVHIRTEIFEDSRRKYKKIQYKIYFYV